MSEKKWFAKKSVWIILLVGILLFFLPDPLDLLTFGTPLANLLATITALVIAVKK